MNEMKLKPCPFCGSNNVSLNHCGLEKGVVFAVLVWENYGDETGENDQQ